MLLLVITSCGILACATYDFQNIFERKIDSCCQSSDNCSYERNHFPPQLVFVRSGLIMWINC